jgi:hypothetical protein
LCAALEIAERREMESLAEYKKFHETCDYLDVRELLEELIRERQQALDLLREKRSMLESRFETLDNITEAYL